MYILKHLPPWLQKRWQDQLMHQHDVDIKRLWRRSPQTLDSMVGAPPMGPDVELPDEDGSSSSGEGSSESEPESASGSSSSSTSSSASCVRVTFSGFTGEAEGLNGTYDLTEQAPGFNFLIYSYEGEGVSIGAYYVMAGGGPGGSWEIRTFTPVEGLWLQYVGVPPLEFYHEDDQYSDAIVTLDPFGCDSSDGSSSEEGSSGEESSGGPSSSSDASSSSSDPGSSSGSSSGGGGGPGSDDTSSSFGSAGYPWEGEASGGGDYDSGTDIDYSEHPDCYTLPCATWMWVGVGWRRIDMIALGVCPEPCDTGCTAVPKQSGYPGLYAHVTCNGRVNYYEP